VQSKTYKVSLTASFVLFDQDSYVTQLTQDLAKLLGLKIRKAYVRSKVCMMMQTAASEKLLNPGSHLLHVIVDVVTG